MILSVRQFFLLSIIHSTFNRTKTFFDILSCVDFCSVLLCRSSVYCAIRPPIAKYQRRTVFEVSVKRPRARFVCVCYLLLVVHTAVSITTTTTAPRQKISMKQTFKAMCIIALAARSQLRRALLRVHGIIRHNNCCYCCMTAINTYWYYSTFFILLYIHTPYFRTGSTRHTNI